jgi:predicted adenine nucleotide alpha hydrolase (AANH) superfamily ATPase
MMKKTYYYDLSIEEIDKIKQLDYKPSILLHSCCAPCSSFPLEFLYPYFNITIYYNNSNIYPLQEYTIRMEEQVRYVQQFNELHDTNVQIIVTTYDEENYHKLLEPLKDEPECGKRCHLCYRLRMEEAYQYAHNNHFDYFCTIMTISRQKSSIVMNQIGQELEQKYPNTKYFYSDFKKKDGLLRRNALVKEYNLYNQTYCGCRYSIRDK